MFKKNAVHDALRAAIGMISFENLGRYLPFQTQIVSGRNYNHIQSLYAFDIETRGKNGETYIVSEGDTLCRRSGYLYVSGGLLRDEDCPGCLAIAHGLITRDIENA